jgi:uncharacterized protein with von Willebrand factor type A (vWA) domain
MKREKNYIVCDDFDALTFKEEKKGLTNGGFSISKVMSDQWLDQLGQEFYNLLYKAKPKVNDRYEGDPSISKIIEGFRLTKEVEQLRQKSRFDQKVATVSAVQLVERIADKLSQRNGRGNACLEAMNTSKIDIDDVNSGPATEVRLLINEAVKEAGKDVEAIQIAAGMLAGSEACPLDRKDVTLKQICELAELVKNNPEVKKMIDMAGQFQQSANKQQASKLSHGVDEIYEVGIGNDLGRLLPVELIKLRRAKSQFYLDFIEKKLMTYKLRGGTEPLEKGPVVACVDVSGSMQRIFYWAKAALLVLHNICVKQRRDLHVIFFNSGIMFDRCVLKNGVVDGVGLMELISFWPEGGTDFEYPLTRSKEIIDEYESTAKKPDIIFITDGGATLQPEWKEKFKSEKRKVGFSLFTFFIGDGGEVSQFRNAVADISDRCAVLNSVAMGDESKYRDMFTI